MSLDLREIKNKQKLINYLDLTLKDFESFVSYYEDDKTLRNSIKITNRLGIIFFLIKILIGVLLTNIVYFLKYRKKNIELKENVFITHFSYYIKASIALKILPENHYSILYVPTIHFKEINKHYDYFKNNENVCFDSFGMKVFLKFFLIFKKIPFFFDLLKDSKGEFGFLLAAILKYRLFSLYADRITQKNKTSKKWIFDNDKSPSFSPIVKKLNSLNICTINLQHGSFFSDNKFYLPSISKYVFCCSEREKVLFVNSGTLPSNVFVIGAPLQSFADGIKQENFNVVYDLLILLTDTTTTENIERQTYLLNILKTSHFKTLIRFRPASKEKDYIILKESIPDYCDISEGKSIEIDIMRSSKIVSFSLDALFVCNRYQKFTCLICSTKVSKELTSSDNFIVYSDDQDIDLDSFIMKESDSCKNDNFSYNFGITDFEKIKKNFQLALNSTA